MVAGLVAFENMREDNSSKALESFAEHLRTIHITLILICFGLITTITLSRKPEADKAFQQLEAISTAASVWKLQSQWPDEYASKLVKDSELKPSDEVSALLDSIQIFHPWEAPEAGISSHRHMIGPRRWTLRDARTSEFEAEPVKSSSGELLTPADALHLRTPTNLTQFFRYWLFLSEPLSIYMPVEKPTQQIDFNKLLPLEDLPDKAKSTEIARDMVLSPYDYNKLEENNSSAQSSVKELTHAFVEPSQPTFEGVGGATVPVKVAPIKQFHAQKAFNETFETSFEFGKPAETFTELDELTKHYQDLPFEKALAILRAEKSRTSDKVELMGAKIPVNELAKWGIPVLLLVQLYLALSLSEFSQRVLNKDMVPDVPWIALYVQKGADLVTWLTVLLPVVTVCLLSWWALHSFVVTAKWHWIVAGALSLTSALVSIKTGKAFRTVRRIASNGEVVTISNYSPEEKRISVDSKEGTVTKGQEIKDT
jgi:hypothetical protein